MEVIAYVGLGHKYRTSYTLPFNPLVEEGVIDIHVFCYFCVLQIVSSSCTQFMECPKNLQESRWLAYDESHCVAITNVSPSVIKEDSVLVNSCTCNVLWLKQTFVLYLHAVKRAVVKICRFQIYDVCCNLFLLIHDNTFSVILTGITVNVGKAWLVLWPDRWHCWDNLGSTTEYKPPMSTEANKETE